MNPYNKVLLLERLILPNLMNKICLESNLTIVKNMCAVYVINQDYLHKLETASQNWEIKNGAN